MAKKKPSKLAKLLTNRKLNRRNVVLTLVCLALVGQLTYWFFHERAQRFLENELTLAGTYMDALAEDLKSADIQGEIKREKNCYRAGRKFEREPIYCREILRVVGHGMRDEDILKNVDIFTSHMLSSRFGLVEYSKRTELSKESDLYYRYEAYRHHLKTLHCWAAIVGRSELEETPLRGTFNSEIECLGGDFDYFFYPAET